MDRDYLLRGIIQHNFPENQVTDTAILENAMSISRGVFPTLSIFLRFAR